MNLAPIILFVYNRPWHVRQTLEALSQNELADKSDLYIYADGFKSGDSPAQVEKISEVRKIIKEKQWCKSISIIESPHNKGLADSVIGGVSDILKISENVIVIEDDVITSPFFLRFMNDALNVFEKEEKVLSISSWNYFTDIRNVPDNFFMQMPDTIAWATWKRSWKLFQYDAGSVYEQLKKQKLLKKFNLDNRYNFEKMLIAQINSKVSSWGIRWTATAVINDTLSFYPNVSLTKHIGFGNDSTNCMTDDYNKDLLLATSPIEVKAIPLKESGEAVKSWIYFEKKVKGSTELLDRTSLAEKWIISNFYKFRSKAAGGIKKLKKIINPLRNKKRTEKKDGWMGDYTSWEDAQQKCTGYDADNILEKVKESVLKVKNGEAVYERDSVVFDKIEYSTELFNAFKLAANEKGNILNVIDFGGSLGSSYYQMHGLLNGAITLHWNVVEQKHFVACGREYIQNDNLKFFYTIEDALAHSKPDVLLVSSVIQYLEDPYSFIEKIISYGFDYIFIDRTAFIDSDKERITVQVVPETIYKASYPAWFLNEKKFINSFTTRYNLLDEFESYCDPKDYIEDECIYWKGFIFKKI